LPDQRALIALCALACAGCSEDSPATPAPDAGADVEEDASIACGTSGVSKGPWVLATTGSSAKIRWEACRAGSARGVVVKPEGGGAELRFDAGERPYVVESTYSAIGAQTDRAGTWYMLDAAVSGLAAGTCYTYALAADAALAGRFCTARPSGQNLRFLAIGDTNPMLGDTTSNILKHVLATKPDFTLHGGDIQYYDSILETWASWFPRMDPLLRAGALFPALGNHEREKPDELEAYVLRFFGGAAASGNDHYYRFESAGVWFFAIDSEMPTDPSTEQGRWLLAQLADAAQKPGFRFSVLFFHRPWVTCGDSGDAPARRIAYESAFAQHKVKLVLQAHMHGYERFEIGETTWVTSGGGGGRMGNVDENASRAECSQRAKSGAFFHAMVFDVEPGKLKGQAIDQTGAVKDTFERAVP
jgi:hypothetical protein